MRIYNAINGRHASPRRRRPQSNQNLARAEIALCARRPRRGHRRAGLPGPPTLTYRRPFIVPYRSQLEKSLLKFSLKKGSNEHLNLGARNSSGPEKAINMMEWAYPSAAGPPPRRPAPPRAPLDINCIEPFHDISREKGLTITHSDNPRAAALGTARHRIAL